MPTVQQTKLTLKTESISNENKDQKYKELYQTEFSRLRKKTAKIIQGIKRERMAHLWYCEKEDCYTCLDCEISYPEEVASIRAEKKLMEMQKHDSYK